MKNTLPFIIFIFFLTSCNDKTKTSFDHESVKNDSVIHAENIKIDSVNVGANLKSRPDSDTIAYKKATKLEKNELKYHYTDPKFTAEDLNNIYKKAKYYITKSQNKLIKLSVQNNEPLEYSIEKRTENNRNYYVLGLGTTFEHKFTVMQWLYIDIENNTIFEYDLGNDALVPFP